MDEAASLAEAEGRLTLERMGWEVIPFGRTYLEGTSLNDWLSSQRNEPLRWGPDFIAWKGQRPRYVDVKCSTSKRNASVTVGAAEYSQIWAKLQPYYFLCKVVGTYAAELRAFRVEEDFTDRPVHEGTEGRDPFYLILYDEMVPLAEGFA